MSGKANACAVYPKKLCKEGAEALATLLTTKKAVDSMGLDSY